MPLSVKETKILKNIVVASENDPNNPEFPADDPKFPATPTYRINVPGFKNVWLKDESQNPTGTHKDRMAWEMVVTYRDFLLAKQKGLNKKPLPHLSVISSGSAAIAIQSQLRKYKLPNLKVLVDQHLDEKYIQALKKLGCQIFQIDLSRQVLSWSEILRLTKNINGFDITSSEALDPTTRFYDWLSYEILNSSPDYCFIPFGTGHLYENILNLAKRELSSEKHDPRFKGVLKKIQTCNFIGATSSNPRTKAEKLYSPHLPFVHYNEQWIRFYRRAGYCGPKSDVHVFTEKYLDQAIAILDSQGVNHEPSGAAGLALLLQLKNKIPTKDKILIVNTGKTKLSD